MKRHVILTDYSDGRKEETGVMNLGHSGTLGPWRSDGCYILCGHMGNQGRQASGAWPGPTWNSACLIDLSRFCIWICLWFCQGGKVVLLFLSDMFSLSVRHSKFEPDRYFHLNFCCSRKFPALGRFWGPFEGLALCEHRMIMLETGNWVLAQHG